MFGAIRPSLAVLLFYPSSIRLVIPVGSCFHKSLHANEQRVISYGPERSHNKIRTCLKRNIDLGYIQNSDEVLVDPLASVFLDEVADIPPLVFDSDAFEVAVCIAGYILHNNC